MSDFSSNGARLSQNEMGPRQSGARPRVLVTEGSSCTARTALYALAADFDVDLLDPSPFCQARFTCLAKRWIRSPRFSENPRAFLEFLENHLSRERYDAIFPTHEEIYVIARARQRLERLAGLAVPAFGAVDCLMSKANFSRLLVELGIPQPPTVIVSSKDELLQANEFPVYIKAALGTAGSGVQCVRSREELNAHVARLEREGRLDGNLEYLIQSPATGTHGSISAVFRHGEMLGWHSCGARRLGVGGAPMAHVSTNHPTVVRHIEHIGQHLDWHGAAFFDFFHNDETGEVAFIEANPRIGQTVNGLLSGVNLSKLLMQVSMNQPVERIPAGRTGVRTHEGFLMVMTKALEGASRRELVGEMLQCWRRTGLYENSSDELTRLADDWLSFIPYTAVTSQLLLSPRLAKRIVASTVRNYSLSPQASQVIRSELDSTIEPAVAAL